MWDLPPISELAEEEGGRERERERENLISKKEEKERRKDIKKERKRLPASPDNQLF